MLSIRQTSHFTWKFLASESGPHVSPPSMSHNGMNTYFPWHYPLHTIDMYLVFLCHLPSVWFGVECLHYDNSRAECLHLLSVIVGHCHFFDLEWIMCRGSSWLVLSWPKHFITALFWSSVSPVSDSWTRYREIKSLIAFFYFFWSGLSAAGNSGK